jgi:hypothetical protein
MDEKMKTAIENTIAMIRSNSKADEALKFSQAALNLVHAKQILESKSRTRGTGA